MVVISILCHYLLLLNERVEHAAKQIEAIFQVDILFAFCSKDERKKVMSYKFDAGNVRFCSSQINYESLPSAILLREK